jgi:hypothetical protein
MEKFELLIPLAGRSKAKMATAGGIHDTTGKSELRAPTTSP